MIRIYIPDMSCQACFRGVEEAVRRVRGVADVRVDPETEEVIVEGDPDREELLSAIVALGYNPEE